MNMTEYIIKWIKFFLFTIFCNLSTTYAYIPYGKILSALKNLTTKYAIQSGFSFFLI